MNKTKTRRGVYLDLEKSPYVFEGYKFSSAKKLDIFIKRVGECYIELQKVYGKIYKISGDNKNYNLDDLIPNILKKVYEEMEYH